MTCCFVISSNRPENPPSAAGTGPPPGDIAAFMGPAALAPVRAYAGLQSAPTAEQRARLAVDDLPRAGGFGRGTLAVVTTTGSGDPSAVDSLEYLTGGDVATVSMQYSYLPSWLSYLVDQKRARELGVSCSTRCTTGGRSCPPTIDRDSSSSARA